MDQADRDRLVTLKKVKKKLITQRQAAEELGIGVRQVKRLLRALKRLGDKAVVRLTRASEQFTAGLAERFAFDVPKRFRLERVPADRHLLQAEAENMRAAGVNHGLGGPTGWYRPRRCP